MILVLIMLSASAECYDGVRGDPVMKITDQGKNHWVYFLPNEKDVCNNYAKLFVKKEVPRVCGCKILKYSSMQDRLRLRCAHWTNEGVVSRTTAIYYYYPNLTRRCNWVRDLLMFRRK